MTDAAEWKYLRRVHDIRIGVEEKLINIRSNGVADLFMLPNETVAVPFVFQSFLSGYSNIPTTNEEMMKVCQGDGLPEEMIQARTITVRKLVVLV